MDRRKEGRKKRRKDGRMGEGACPHTPFANQTLPTSILGLKGQQVQGILI